MTAGAAEFVVVPADRVGPVPAALSSVEAASLVVAGATALIALRDTVHPASGERVLVRGAAGGVGTAAVQLARALGGQVTALARDRHAAALVDLGAEKVLDYGTTTPDQIGPFDVIVDTVGSELGRYRSRLAKGGRMITVGLSGPALAAITASSVHGARRIRTFSANPDAPCCVTSPVMSPPARCAPWWRACTRWRTSPPRTGPSSAAVSWESTWSRCPGDAPAATPVLCAIGS